MRMTAAAVVAAMVLMWAGPTMSHDRHQGYYYPKPSTREVYDARSETLPQANRDTRIGFVTGISSGIGKKPFPPQAIMFVKGAQSEKLILVSLVDGRMDTIYRVRAVLADMTAAARSLPAFQELGVQNRFTFLDLAKMLGFKQMTITNGRAFAHQIVIE